MGHRIKINQSLTTENLTIKTYYQGDYWNQDFHYHKISESCFCYSFIKTGSIGSWNNLKHKYLMTYPAMHPKLCFFLKSGCSCISKNRKILKQFQRNDFMTCPSKFPWIQFPQCRALQWTSFEQLKLLTGHV